MLETITRRAPDTLSLNRDAAFRQRGFTLFEVALSLTIVTFSVVSVLMLFPSGLKAQQLSRYQLYAAAKAQDMVESFYCTQNANPATDTEAFNSWDVPIGYRSQTWDLESRIATTRFGIMPLPMDIARRLESDQDEIQQTLSEGGYLYYSQPHASSGLEEETSATPAPAELQKLVFTVRGFAQNNAIHSLHRKAWPYEAPYPSPPLHGKHWNEFLAPGSVPFTWPGGTSICWEAGTTTAGVSLPGADADVKAVWDAFKTYSYDNTPNEANAVAYVQAALGYCVQKGLTATFFDPSTIPNPVPTFEPGTLDARGADPTHVAWKQVNAMRFLSHAATCMTRWKSSTDLASGAVVIPAAGSAPSLILTNDKIVYYHDRCLNLIMRFAASFPYDWAVPRPLQRCLMTDYPLMERDLFSLPAAGKIWEPSGGSIDACQWKPIPAQPIHNVGLGYQFPTFAIPDGSAAASPEYQAFWGEPAHFTLTKPFMPAERCREIVFWTVDWQQYEDCETAPSAPVDASRYPFQAPLRNRDFRTRMESVDFRDEQLYAYRNPEKTLLFTKPTATLPTGTDTSAMQILNHVWSDQPDRGDGPGRRQTFSGMYGADRNFNKQLDRGSLPKSVRLRATSVARFIFYDPRLIIIGR